MAERVQIHNGISNTSQKIEKKSSFLDKSDVVIVAFIDYNKDKRLYRTGSKLFEYKDTVVYSKILGTVPKNETIRDFIEKNKETINQYEIVFLEIYQNPERISFQDLIFEGMLK